VDSERPRESPANSLSTELGSACLERVDKKSTVSVLIRRERPMKSLHFVMMALFVAACGISALAQEQVRAASLPYLTVRVALTHTPAGVPRLEETFSTNDPRNHNLYCISGFLDLKYVLRGSAGKEIPASKDPWTRGTDMQYSRGMSWNPKGPEGSDPCKAIKTDKAFRVVLLPVLYPNLPHGMYTLRVVLAPRGTGDRATSAPLALAF
jgi:hypothetical protein